jgi:aspartyl-tRNA(Asn)/glutamyl-tRNA(Gln) amidotransferase subunit A
MADLTVRQSVDAALAKIETSNADIRALVHVDPVDARIQADDLDRSGSQGSSLFGKTFVAKDLIDVAHQPTQAGSWLFGKQPADRDATCVARLRRPARSCWEKPTCTSLPREARSIRGVVR